MSEHVIGLEEMLEIFQTFYESGPGPEKKLVFNKRTGEVTLNGVYRGIVFPDTIAEAMASPSGKIIFAPSPPKG